jgi:hypothetical protein
MQEDRAKDKELRRLVRQIINGKPLSDVPISQIPELRSGLTDAQSKALSDSQITRFKVIQRILTDLTRIERSHERTVRSATDRPRPKKARLDPSELDTLIEGLLTNRGFLNEIATGIIPLLIRRLKRRRIPAHIRSSEFENSQQAQELIYELQAELRIRAKTADRANRDDRALQSLESAEANLQAAQDVYGDELDQFELSMAAGVDRVNTENQREVEVLDAEQYAPLPAFSMTFSSELQNLKATKQHLIFAKRFHEAGLVHNQLREMTDNELGVIEARHSRSQELARQRLLARHNQKVACTTSKFESDRVVMVQRNERRIDQLKQAVVNRERRLGHSVEWFTSARVSEADWRSSIVGQSPVRRRKDVCKPAASDLPEPYWKTAVHEQTEARRAAQTPKGREVTKDGAAQMQADQLMTFTQMVDARRSARTQAKMSLAALFRELDGMDGLPQGRKAARRHRLALSQSEILQ